MKILRLRFQNLNSLYGDWSIDFTSPEYVSDGIFALTGPTGSGKSTILDAICLALYGATPRLGKITATNDIMSRGTGECFAEVTFESQAGAFSCHWSQHRARRKATGNLASSRHEISDAITGKILETKKSLTTRIVEEKTGMDFQRFTRSILLAQGSFDSFLKADIEDKSRILEQITGTEIYTQISLAVHERLRVEKEKLGLLQAEISGIKFLEPEQITEMNRQIKELLKNEKEQNILVETTRNAVNWYKTIAGLRRELQELKLEAETLSIDMEAFMPMRKRLVNGVAAKELQSEYAALSSLRKAQKENTVELATQCNALKTDKPAVKTAEAETQQALMILRQVKTRAEQNAPVIKAVRELDHKISSLNHQIRRENTEIDADEQRLIEHGKTRQKLEQMRTQYAKEFDQWKRYQTEHAVDEKLEADLLILDSQLKDVSVFSKQLENKKKSLKSNVKNLNERTLQQQQVQARLKIRQNEFQTLNVQIAEEKAELTRQLDNRSLQDYRREKDSLHREQVYQERIARLESDREKLVDGKACPLCGSLDHPFARGNIPKLSETEKKIEDVVFRIEKAEKSEARIHKLENNVKVGVNEINQLEKDLLTIESEVINLQDRMEILQQSIEDDVSQISERFTNIAGRLKPYGIIDLDIDKATQIQAELGKRQEQWIHARTEVGRLEKEINHLQNEINKIEASDKVIRNSIHERKTTITSLDQEQSEFFRQRKELFGDKNPDSVEKQLKSDCEKAEKELLQKQTATEKARLKLKATHTRIEALNTQISKRTSALSDAEKVFIQKGIPLDIPDEKTYLDYVLPEASLRELKATAKSLEDRELRYNERHADRKKRLVTEEDRHVTDLEYEIVEQQLSEQESCLIKIREEMIGLNQRLNDNKTAMERIKDKKALIDAQKKETNRWNRLHSLIGSSDGKKFRNFAQGLTFELMIQHANQQLSKMSDRYILIRDLDSPLELNVIDNYQGGEVRSIRNLSGGESFIVSLTLALGLSNMASQTVRVDSLFLDEGFGTLDEEALETALETLAGLHQDGKLIGVISHVSALRERITTQIKIQPISGGKSVIEGPGCKQGN